VCAKTAVYWASRAQDSARRQRVFVADGVCDAGECVENRAMAMEQNKTKTFGVYWLGELRVRGSAGVGLIPTRLQSWLRRW
jgi:hypothetical protein